MFPNTDLFEHSAEKLSWTFLGGIVWNVVLKKEDIIIYPLFPFASSFLSLMRAVVQKEGSRQVFQEWRHVSFGVTASAF